MKFNTNEILNNTDSKLLTDNIEGEFNISTDTRTIKKGDIYLPLRGENFDGHNFIDKAIEMGAIGYFTQDKRKINKNAKLIFHTKNCLITYLNLAKYIRLKFNPKTIAITGSCGKTTVKEMLSSVLSKKFNTHKSILNHNNEIGLCETMFNMPNDTEVLIVEMGMRNLGEIEMLSKYCQQNISIITNVGSAHVERLGSLDNIALAKCEIASHLDEKEGILYAYNSDRIKQKLNFKGEVHYLSLSDVTSFDIKENSTKFTYKNNEYEIKIEGEHNIENALFAIEIGTKLGMDIKDIKQGLLEFKPIEKRWEITKLNGATIINDSYNANPESMIATLKTFLSVYKSFSKILVLGDMLELGHDEIKYHTQIGDFLEKYKDIQLVTVGNLARHIGKNSITSSKHFKNNLDCAKYLKNTIKNGDILFFKASRSMKFEEIIEGIGKDL